MNKNKKPYFITIEGIEGAGKSTVTHFIEKYLQGKNIEFILTREPGGTEIAEEIRKVILSHYHEQMCPYTELLLYFASRAQHIEKVIKPGLAANKWVISDRFTDSSYAYQGIGRSVPEQHVAILENLIQGDLRPDLTIVLDVEPEVGLERVKSTNILDRIESEKIDFFQDVRKYYLRRVEEYPERYKIIDANKSPKEVEQQLIKILAEIHA
jgi:dTMP kinase